MTTSELEGLLGQRIPAKWAVVALGERTLWKQSDGSWVDYEEERRERDERRDATRDSSA